MLFLFFSFQKFQLATPSVLKALNIDQMYALKEKIECLRPDQLMILQKFFELVNGTEITELGESIPGTRNFAMYLLISVFIVKTTHQQNCRLAQWLCFPILIDLSCHAETLEHGYCQTDGSINEPVLHHKSVTLLVPYDKYQEMFWEVNATSMILTTSPIECRLIYKNMVLSPYT